MLPVETEIYMNKNGNLKMDMQTKATVGAILGTLLYKLQFHESSCISLSDIQTRHQTIEFCLEEDDASDTDHERTIRILTSKFGPSRFFCNLEGHFKSDCLQFWYAVAETTKRLHQVIKLARHVC